MDKTCVLIWLESLTLNWNKIIKVRGTTAAITDTGYGSGFNRGKYTQLILSRQFTAAAQSIYHCVPSK